LEKDGVLTPEVLVQAVKNGMGSIFGSLQPIKVCGVVGENKVRSYSSYCFLDLKGNDGTKIVAKLPRAYEEEVIGLSPGSVLVLEGIPSVEWSNYKGAFEVIVVVSRIVDSKAGGSLVSVKEIDLTQLLGRKLRRSVNVKEHLKGILRRGEKPRIVLITGTTSVADSDVKTAAQSALNFYELTVARTNLLSPEAIEDELKKWSERSDAHLIAVARGGGEGLEVFNDPSLCKTALDCKKPIVSALGHSTDVSYFDLFVDASFSVPAEFGKFLKEVYEETGREEKLYSVLREKDEELKRNYEAIKRKDEEVKRAMRSGFILGVILSSIFILLLFSFFRRG